MNGEGFKILLEILAKLRASKIKEVPYTFRPRTRGQSKLSGRVIRQYVQQLWRLCSSSQHLFVRFMKSVVVGGAGVFANLAVMALLLKLAKTPDWRASAFASLAANAQNYALQNVWTTADRSRKTFGKSGWISFLFARVCSRTDGRDLILRRIGVEPGQHVHLITTGTANTAFYARICCQFSAVLLGIWTMARPEQGIQAKGI